MSARRWRATALLLVLAMIMAACTSSSDTEPDDPDAPATTEAAGESEGESDPTTGGEAGGDVGEEDVFVHAGDDEPLSLDPAQVEAGEYGEAVILQVYDRLVEFGPDGPDLMPGLATEVPSTDNGLISADGLTYTFPLREGVSFHDGSPFTADDVVFSWDRAMTMSLPEGTADLLNDNVASMQAVDDFTFEVTLQAPNAAFLNSIVTASVAAVVSQEVVEANGGVVEGTPNEFMATNPIGTGPFKFVEWNRNENLIFEKNDDYFGQVPALDLRIEIGPDPDVRVLGLRAGEYDMIETDPSFIGDIEGAEGVVIYSEGLLLEPIHIGLNLNITDLPEEDTIPADFFHDPRIRQAFNYAFDYEAFLNGALGGFGDFNPHYIPQGIFGYDPTAPVYQQDLAKAEELFREAGYWDEGFTVSVITEEANLFEIAALVLKDSIEGLNPNMQIRVLAVAEAQFDEAHASNPVPYAMWVKNADPFADPEAYLRAYAHPDGEWGEIHDFGAGYQDPERIAGLIDDAAQETDTTKRAELYAEVQRLLFEDPMWIIAAQEGVAVAYRDRVQGFVHNPLWPRPNVRWNYFSK
ncbi:MAG: ABC transporter substrate-binding protein [Acidimicrobiia bacterium]|nr:ABC transporter substrate-binding protein [Acidimicrobiia bacterium]MDH4307312.1 ABC transporter substrate-binding protein [Acidimicrobiia bacterium]MDH5519667.1 ABC transporter substrate-binding protein [Acidimicrobiia bacterium]